MRRRSLALAVALAGGCATPDDVEVGQALQYVRQAGGHYEFYIGSEVIEELRETGRFEPGPRKRYSLVRVPSSVVDLVAPDDPASVSLCRADHDVTLAHQIVLSPEELAEYLPVAGQWQDPHFSFTEFGMMQTYHSGDEGVFGMAQVHRDDAWGLLAGAAADLRIPFGDEPGYRTGGLLLGVLRPDDLVEDPLLAADACVAPLP